MAAEASYHRTCYRDYVRPEKKQESKKESTRKNAKEYSSIEQKAHNLLFDYIRNEMFQNPQVTLMTEITTKFVEYMNELGVDKVTQQSRRYLPKKLEHEFGDSIRIFPDVNGKLIVIPDNLCIEELVHC